MAHKNDELPAEIPETALDKMQKKRQKRRHHPSHTQYNPSGAAEEHAVQGRLAKLGKKRKSKLYDGRALYRRSRNDMALRSFYEEVDLPQFKEALNFTPDARFQMLLAAISAPRLHECSFSELCRRCSLTLNDITSLWRNHQLQRSIMRAMNHMPDIAEDTAIDAKTRVVPCENCDETGKVASPINKQKLSICPTCHGDGKYRIIGDKDARSLMFESAGLRRSAVSTQVNVNVGAMPSMEDAIANVEKALDIQATEVRDGGNGNGEQKVTQEDRAEAGSDPGAAADAVRDAADTTGRADSGSTTAFGSD